jgi:hypothetical protein
MFFGLVDPLVRGVDPHHVDADTDSTYYPDADPDPDPSFQIKA